MLFLRLVRLKMVLSSDASTRENRCLSFLGLRVLRLGSYPTPEESLTIISVSNFTVFAINRQLLRNTYKLGV